MNTAAMNNHHEQARLDRIASNRAKMEEMGLFQSAQVLRQALAAGRNSAKRPRTERAAREPRGTGSTRRSGRNAGQAAPCYDERVLDNIRETGTRRTGTKAAHREWVASGEEAYSQEDLTKLGDHQDAWELFVDGFGADGKRIYCKIEGKTCHQCRQKTLGHHTSCSHCESKAGQFCGDCLFMRYGENVLEVAKNPDWQCPKCRDICNCSFCRIRKGWAPTGALYPRARQEGYKSVAHYLMQTGVQGRNVVAEAAAAAAPTPAAAASAPKPAEGPAPAELPAETEASPGQAPADSAAEPEAPSSLPAPVPAAAPRPARTRASAQVTVTSLLPATKTAAARKGKLQRKAGKENALGALQPSSLGIAKSGLAGSLRRTTRACGAH